jgi:hypothetical protein
MNKAIRHFRGNVVAYLALFVALGGTGYAAISVPRNSVGTRQLRNGAVTEKKLAKGAVTATKLDSRSIAGSVVFWAEIRQDGSVARSSQLATTSGWSTGTGKILFRGRLSGDCFALANVLPLGAAGSVSPLAGASIAGQEELEVQMTPSGGTESGPLPVAVAVICPD